MDVQDDSLWRPIISEAESAAVRPTFHCRRSAQTFSCCCGRQAGVGDLGALRRRSDSGWMADQPPRTQSLCVASDVVERLTGDYGGGVRVGKGARPAVSAAVRKMSLQEPRPVRAHQTLATANHQPGAAGSWVGLGGTRKADVGSHTNLAPQ